MRDFIVELVLIATIVAPLIATSLEPARATPTRKSPCRFRKLRRTH